jgi:hypothetical protein
VVKLPYDDGFSTALSAQGVDVLFVCDGLQAEAAQIRQLARASRRMTVGANETYVKEGMAVGVFSEGNRNRIVVNLHAAKEEGVEISSQLLQLATVIP